MTVEQKDQLSNTPLELENSTLEEIVDALLAGSPIALPQNAGLFILDSEDARAAFRFYASRTELWPQQKPLSSAEVDQLLQALEQYASGHHIFPTQPPKAMVSIFISGHHFSSPA
ncbi:hypothetical protein L4P19_002119 [Pseudomonas aeruginosa]|nr:hypothetical protein [Pseudomonas aeruginosa]EKV3073123.1 hypothetical protein [Pseudomonas aeruginosa]